MATLLNQITLHRAIDPDSKDDAAFDAQVLDKQAFDNSRGVLFLVLVGSVAAAIAALKVQQSDVETDATTLGGDPTDVHDVTAKPASDDDDSLVAVYVPMDKWTQRYLQLQATAGDGSSTASFLAAVAIADRIGESAVTAESLNVEAVEIAS